MPNFASALKEEIRRLARKEGKALVAPLKKALATERKAVAKLRKQVAANARTAGKAARSVAAKAVPVEAAGKSRGGRALAEGWRKDTVRSTRKALGLTQGQFAKLVGVSQITVSFWETGRSTPRLAQQNSVLAARELGRDKALARLGLPPGYKARRGRPSNADLAARKKAGKKAGKRPAKRKTAKKSKKKAGARKRKK
ncbi:MAG TPA: helix-turn-helix domain-containing protein [Planctomycetota bacterium]|nr:helix-turn-helix domain-containing protein [Planctomycetota bacterium]